MEDHKIDNIDLEKVTGGYTDTTKRYSFYTGQRLYSNTDPDVHVTILNDYNDVPYDTKIYVNYADMSKNHISVETTRAYILGDNFH